MEKTDCTNRLEGKKFSCKIYSSYEFCPKGCPNYNTKPSRDYEKLIESGNKAQLEKLLQNEHKPGFEDIDIVYAYKRIKQEESELFWEIFNGKENVDFSKIRHEAADIANFAHMIIYKCDQEIIK